MPVEILKAAVENIELAQHYYDHGDKQARSVAEHATHQELAPQLDSVNNFVKRRLLKWMSCSMYWGNLVKSVYIPVDQRDTNT